MTERTGFNPLEYVGPDAVRDAPLHPLKMLAFELDAVLIDTKDMGKFDHVCRDTVKRVRDELIGLAVSETAPQPDAIRDALDHIMRVSRQGISPTKRLDWIEIRARYALEGKPWSPDIRETPRDSVKKMEKDFAACRADLAKATANHAADLSAPCVERQIEDTVTLPKEPPEMWFRPFIMCPADEVLLAWQAFLKIAEKMRGNLAAPSGPDGTKT